VTRPAPSLRLFVAIYPPPAVAETLTAWLSRLNLPPYRATPTGQVHITLQFIGDTDSAALDDVIESVRRAASGIGVLPLAATALVTLPERGPARLVAADANGPPPLLELQRRLAQRLARNARERAGDRFRPHMTLARFRSPAPRTGVNHALDPLPFEVLEVLLMRSVLRPDGAQHDVVERIPL
jgi:RNA 2',3'-cyclic 3'-phosphodiesterase